VGHFFRGGAITSTGLIGLMMGTSCEHIRMIRKRRGLLLASIDTDYQYIRWNQEMFEQDKVDTL